MGKGILIALLLAGCSAAREPSNFRISDEATEPPMGYVEYCQRVPEARECGG